MPLDEDTAPSSQFRFELILLDLGFGDKPKRDALLEYFHARLNANNPRDFRREVLAAIRAEPERYRDWMNGEGEE